MTHEFEIAGSETIVQRLHRAEVQTGARKVHVAKKEGMWELRRVGRVLLKAGTVPALIAELHRVGTAGAYVASFLSTTR
jgi:hypothetical protein